MNGSSVGAADSYTFTNVTSAQTISVSFAIDTKVITSSAGEHGEISPSGETLVGYGSDKTYTMIPSTNYHVADVLVDGKSVGAVTSYTFKNIESDHTISVTFDNTRIITSSVIGTGGSINPLGNTSIINGADQNYTITPIALYHIADVLVDGLSVGAVASYTFTNVTSAHTISVRFSIDTNDITASAGDHGSISPSGDTPVNYGADQTFTITPDSDFSISDVIVDGVSKGAISSYTFSNVVVAHTITASFVQHIDLKTPSLSFDQISDKSHKFISISKNKVSVNGGQKIKIKFDKFHEPPTEVLFDNVRAKMISSAVDMVVVIVPAHKLGTVDITISNSKELITLPKAFVYLK
ncbi:MAG: hypothetical protein A2X78_04665 [Gammaproteobacteria bacterium GWE2_37_16]|nr:MAG: hypothetical protein A2X78_04665 [Gammaproteobacteria bacterium GWE2_37_16]